MYRKIHNILSFPGFVYHEISHFLIAFLFGIKLEIESISLNPLNWSCNFIVRDRSWKASLILIAPLFTTLPLFFINYKLSIFIFITLNGFFPSHVDMESSLNSIYEIWI